MRHHWCDIFVLLHRSEAPGCARVYRAGLLLTGNKAKAQAHLAALEKVCGRGCEEYRDLA